MSGYGPAFRRKVDANHASVREEYRRFGCYVKDVSRGQIGDLFVIVPCNLLCRLGSAIARTLSKCCRRFFVEVKKDEKEPLTENEKEWQLLLGDQFVIVRSLDDVRKSVNGN